MTPLDQVREALEGADTYAIEIDLYGLDRMDLRIGRAVESLRGELRAALSLLASLTEGARPDVKPRRYGWTKELVQHLEKTGWPMDKSIVEECSIGQFVMHEYPSDSSGLMDYWKLPLPHPLPTPRLFDPALTPPPDEFGLFMHPDIDIFLPEENVNFEDVERIGKRLGFEFQIVQPFEEDGYYWKPKPSEGDGWNLMGIGTCDEGEFACFVRPLPPTDTEQEKT